MKQTKPKVWAYFLECALAACFMRICFNLDAAYPFLAAMLYNFFLKHLPWWHHQMQIFSAVLAICVGNSPVTGEFPTQRLAMRSFDVFFDLRLNKLLSKQLWGWWFEMLSCSLWRHCNACVWGNQSSEINNIAGFYTLNWRTSRYDSGQGTWTDVILKWSQVARRTSHLVNFLMAYWGIGILYFFPYVLNWLFKSNQVKILYFHYYRNLNMHLRD